MSQIADLLGGVRIVLAEGDADLAEDVRACLVRLGADVVDVVATRLTARESTERNRPELVLIDLGLEGDLPAAEAAAAIRDGVPTPVVYLAEDADAQTIARADKADPFGYVFNPRSELELCTVIRGALRRAGLERNLAVSEGRFESTLSTIREGVIATDADGRVTSVNPVAEALLERSFVEARGQPIDQVLLFADGGPGGAAGGPAMSALRDRRVVRVSRRIAAPSNASEAVPVEVAAAPILASNQRGQLVGAVVALRDEREHVWLAAADADGRRRALLIDSLPYDVYIFDVDTMRTTFENRALWQNLGYSHEDMERMERGWIEELLHPDDWARMPSLLSRWETIADGVVLETECRIRDKEGRWRWYLCRDTVLQRSCDGRVRKVIGAAQDITERKEAEERLRESEERLRVAVRATDLGPWDWNIQTGEVDFSPEWKHQIGYEDGEITNRVEDWSSRLHPEDRERVLAALQDYLEGRCPG